MKRIIALILVCCTSFVMQNCVLSAYGNYEEPTLPTMFYTYKGEVLEFPLQSYKADVDIVGNIANVKLTQTFINASGQKLDAKYRFPGSTQAAVHGMTMKIKDRVIYAQIQEKQEARKTYETAKAEGKRASLLSQEKPNIFTTEVANIYAGDTIQVIVEYSEIIEYKEYVYSFVLPTKIGERYQGVYENIGRKGDYVLYKNPYADKEVDFDINVSISSIFDISKVYCKTHNISTEIEDGKTLVHFNTTAALDRDFILNYEMESKKVESGLILHEGEKENFFLLMLQAPRRVPAEEILPREYVFVVDVSGSMNGKPIETAVELFGNLLESTNEDDMFNVMKFAGASDVLFEKSMPASLENLQKGFDFLSKERGGGGTELLPALKRAMDLPKADKYSRSIILITDGFINADLEVIEYIGQNLDKGNIFPFGIGNSVNRYLIEGLANISLSEPFIITDMEDANQEAKKFKEYIESPVMTDIEIEFEGFDAYDLVPNRIPDVFAQRPIIISGKYKGHPSGLVRVSGLNGKQEMKTYFQIERFAEMDTSDVLQSLWARRKLQTMQDFPGEYSYNNKEQNKEEIINLGLKYHLMTNYTSFVAVDTEVGEDTSSSSQSNPSDGKEDVEFMMSPLTLSRSSASARSGSGSCVTASRMESTQILVEGMDMSKKFTVGEIPAKTDNSQSEEVFFDSIDFEAIGVQGNMIQTFPVKNGQLDLSFSAGDTFSIDMDKPFYRGAQGVIGDGEALENIIAKHLGRDAFSWNNYNFSFYTDKNKKFCAIDIPVEQFEEADDAKLFINELIEAINNQLENVEPNSIYSTTVKINPSGKFTLDNQEFLTEFIDYYFWREKKDMTMIEDGSKYTLYFEIWDANKKLVVKGMMDDLMNANNPFIKSIRGNLKIPKDEFCMHYVQIDAKNLKLGDILLMRNQHYYIKLKGEFAESGN